MLTIKEYELLMKAAELRETDLDYRLHMQAFLNVQARAKKKAGKNKEKYVYNRFDKFYDYKNAVDQIMNPEHEQGGKFEGIGSILKKQRGGEGDG